MKDEDAKPAGTVEPEEIPELDDVVAAPDPAVPPPNLDLFADSGIDVEALRAELAARLGEEIDGALAELRAEFEEILRLRVEARLRDRLPGIIDAVIAEPPSGHQPPE